MNKTIIISILATILISCTKEEPAPESQQYDCDCESLEVYDPDNATLTPINIRPCNVDSELDGASRETYLKEFKDMPKNIALEIAKRQGCKN